MAAAEVKDGNTQLAARGAWALVDQGVASGGTFVMQLLLARGLAPAEYGIFALIFSGALYLNSLYAALVTYPLEVHGSLADEAGIRRLTRESLGVGMTVLVPIGVAILVVAAWFGRPALGPTVVAAVGFWQLQETVRRALHAQMRHRSALTGDALAYAGQAAAVWVLGLIGRLSIMLTLGVMAVTSLVGGLVQLAQLGLRAPFATRDEVVQAWRRNWALGRWPLLGSFVGGAGLQVMTWSLAGTHGTGDTGGLQALVNVVNAANPVMFGVANILLPAVVRAANRRDNWHIARVAVQYTGQGGLLVIPYFLALAVWPELVLGLAYGSRSSYLALGADLRLLAISSMLGYLSGMVGVVLNGLQRTRAGFVVVLLSSVVALAVGVPLATQLGVFGACLAWVIFHATRLLAGLVTLGGLLDRGPRLNGRQSS